MAATVDHTIAVVAANRRPRPLRPSTGQWQQLGHSPRTTGRLLHHLMLPFMGSIRRQLEVTPLLTSAFTLPSDVMTTELDQPTGSEMSPRPWSRFMASQSKDFHSRPPLCRRSGFPRREGWKTDSWRLETGRGRAGVPSSAVLEASRESGTAGGVSVCVKGGKPEI